MAADGSLVGCFLWVNEGVTGGQKDPFVGISDDASFIVTWTDVVDNHLARWISRDAPDDDLGFGPYGISNSPR